MAHRRPLPPSLADQLRSLRALERSATTRADRIAAITSTGALLLAAYEAGWRLVELAPAADVNPSALGARVRLARTLDGLDRLIVEAPASTTRTAPPEGPDWIRAGDACHLAGVTYATLRRWRQQGRLSAHQVSPHRYVYARADICALT